MKSFLQFFTENQNKTAVLAYGRYNPPTIGHQKLIDKVVETANSNGADYFIIPSHSIKPVEKNPLPLAQKIVILKYMVPNDQSVLTVGTTYISALQNLQERGYQHIIQIAGSDREKEFADIVSRYNGIPDKSGIIPFKFESFKFESSGERDPDSEGVEGMSASKLRQLALDNKLSEFENGMANSVPKTLKEKTFNLIRQAILK